MQNKAIKDFKVGQVIQFNDFNKRIYGTVMAVSETKLDVSSEVNVHEVTAEDFPELITETVEEFDKLRAEGLL